jgi:hypothetical protein
MAGRLVPAIDVIRLPIHLPSDRGESLTDTPGLSAHLAIHWKSHPQLTTMWSGEIIGPTYGFATGPAFYSAQATEQDDMRHWSRFEHFRKVKGELKRPGLTMREDTGMGGGPEKGFCFMRWKERFLVPDHKVRDISGASFAGESLVGGQDLLLISLQAFTIFSSISIRRRLVVGMFAPSYTSLTLL